MQKGSSNGICQRLVAQVVSQKTDALGTIDATFQTRFAEFFYLASDPDQGYILSKHLTADARTRRYKPNVPFVHHTSSLLDDRQVTAITLNTTRLFESTGS